jgi:hypothetical protein
MALTSDNILQQVRTYQPYTTGFLQNYCCLLSIANTKFEQFQNLTANYGNKVAFRLRNKTTAAKGLTANFSGFEQRISELTVTQAANVSHVVNDPERIFNLEKTGEQFMSELGKDDIAQLGTEVEVDIAKNLTSSVDIQDNFGNPSGNKLVDSGPYRFFYTGITNGIVDPLNSFQQLAQMITNFRNIGTVYKGVRAIIPDVIVPAIVGNGLSQFVPTRNDEQAMSWEIGKYGSPEVEYYQSNLLPIHYAGTVGDNTSPGGNELTVVSVNDPTGQNVTQITFDGAPSDDADAIKYADLFEFMWNVPGYANLFWLTFYGYHPSAQKVQCRVTADAGSTGTQVTVNIRPGLSWVAGPNKNINRPIVPGMKVKVMPSHRAGGIISDNALYVGMPKLPSTEPFPSSAEYDDTTGVSMRLRYGSKLETPEKGIIYDTMWGSLLLEEYSSRILLPISGY